MATEKQMTYSKATYKKVCESLDNLGWTYDRDDEGLNIFTGASGVDLNISLRICIEPDKCLATVLSELPFVADMDSMVETSLVISYINNSLVDGSFDYNPVDGSIFFRNTVAFHDSNISEKVFGYMIYITCRTVDRYNGMLKKLASSEISFSEAIEMIDGNK
jgi:hypothetical protein